MINNGKSNGFAFEEQVAETYRAQGYDVIIEPQKSDLPFDLNSYHPDLLVKKSPDEGYIIEIKPSLFRVPVDRYREIAELVSEHAGWRFLLITGEDALNGQAKTEDGLLSYEQMLQRQNKAETLLSLGEIEGAFVSLWGVLEAALRWQAKKATIPIERFPTSSLINHLYSQGELSIAQFDQAKMLQEVRNRFVHGYQTDNLAENTRQQQALVGELLALEEQ